MSFATMNSPYFSRQIKFAVSNYPCVWIELFKVTSDQKYFNVRLLTKSSDLGLENF